MLSATSSTMEASLASLSIKEGSTTRLTSLPPELLTTIAAHLPLGSLARFSLISRFVRDAIQPQLYRKVRLWSREDSKPKEAQCHVVKSVLKSSATDPKRCELIRELDLREWRWMGEGEMVYLEDVLRCARRLKGVAADHPRSRREPLHSVLSEGVACCSFSRT
ncbi:hypothetical protein BCR35DRAFT_219929 [Leucosporidium creatinivorum]|uniref:F-box domain-containing protein n=1 Tax=Leucosporidium creatinivorum TaxID=106004 RepID=A0A1Y2FX69_9BASI|nr:hypothetical protein BCR35DRAFT_219929 [Leucosporidium creatinivorum]